MEVASGTKSLVTDDHAGQTATLVKEPVAASSKTILLAEDDPTVRQFVSSVLQNRGYKVLLAENGRQALALCVSHSGLIHAIVTDVVMPEMNGRELAERARLMRPNLKVLFVSGYADRGPKEEDVANPSYAFLEKPFTEEALLNVVESLCGASVLAD